MQATHPTSPNAGAETGVRTLPQPACAGLPVADACPPTRTLDRLVTDLAGLVDDPGAIEYASWMRLIRSDRA